MLGGWTWLDDQGPVAADLAKRELRALNYASYCVTAAQACSDIIRSENITLASKSCITLLAGMRQHNVGWQPPIVSVI
jgi:hypothetical protein